VTLNTSLLRLVLVYHDAPILLCINQRTKFEVRSFTDCKYMMGPKLKTGHFTLTTPIRG